MNDSVRMPMASARWARSPTPEPIPAEPPAQSKRHTCRSRSMSTVLAAADTAGHGGCQHGAMADERAVVEELIAAINAHDRETACKLFVPEGRMVTAGGRTLDIGGIDALLRHTMEAF